MDEGGDTRERVVRAAQAMAGTGLNRGASGNVSVRAPDGAGLWITPSGIPADRITPASIVEMDWEGRWTARNDLRPSSEWRFHRDILRTRPEFGAVVHAHPVHATALAVHKRGIPPFHYMVAIAGGHDIRCAAYATFGTQALSDAVLAAMAGRRACLMAHHGLVAAGVDAEAALTVAVEVERMAAQYLAALGIGAPPLLGHAEIDAVLEKMAAGAGYGSAPGSDPDR